jgi:hypothetical protein
MTIAPFQNLILNTLENALLEGGWDDTKLYFDQLTPLAILSQQAEETDKTISEVAEETNKEMENPSTTEENMGSTPDSMPPISLSSAFFKNEYEIYNTK